jgi:hypothetical protein
VLAYIWHGLAAVLEVSCVSFGSHLQVVFGHCLLGSMFAIKRGVVAAPPALL